MGLNDNVYTISKTLKTERQERQEQKEQKERLQEKYKHFKSVLLTILIKSKKQDINIYDENFKDYIIETIMNEYINNIKNTTWRQRFIENYKDLITTFLNNNYYIIASQAERIAKKQLEPELKQQKELERLEKLKQKEAERLKTESQKRSAQNTKVIMQIITIILKICFYIMFLPILATGFFFIGFFKAVMK